MKLEQYCTILEKIAPSAQLICLYNWGEPLLNPDLVPIIAATAQHGIRTHIDTNFSIRDLSEPDAEALVRSGLTSLFVSIDGASQSTYEKYRVRGNLARVLANLSLMIRTKKRLQSMTPYLGWQFHVHRHNENDMGIAKRMSEDIGVPIVFKRLSTPEAEWKSSYHHCDDMFIGDRAWFWQIYNAPGNPDVIDMKFHPLLVSACQQLFGTMTIEWNGDVYPCTTVASSAHIMGNLLRDTLEEVWNGRQFKMSRTFVQEFGPFQGGQSICENQACALTKKCMV